MTDTERLEKIYSIAARCFTGNTMSSAVRGELQKIILLCSSSDEFIALNIKQFDIEQNTKATS